MKTIPVNALSRAMINQMINELSSELIEAQEEHVELKDGKVIEEDIVTSNYYYVFHYNDAKLKEEMLATALIDGEELTIKVESVTKEKITILCPYIGEIFDSLTVAVDASFILKKTLDRLRSFKNYSSEIVNAIVNAGTELFEKTICLKEEDIFYRVFNQSIVGIWGPPGTGKTTLLSNIIPIFCDNDRFGKTLVVAPSNKAIDEAAYRTISNYTGSARMVRCGYVNEKIKSLPNATPRAILQREDPALFEEAEYLKNMIRDSCLSKDKRMYYAEQLHEVKKIIREKENEIVNSAKCVFTTIAKAIVDPTFSSGNYETVIIDEVGMVLLPMLFIVIQNAKRVIFLGDFKQLPGIVQSGKAEILKEDIFSLCKITESVEKNCGHKWLCMLNEQFRMAPDIAEFLSDEFYHGLLKTNECVKDRVSNITKLMPNKNQAIAIADTGNLIGLNEPIIDGVVDMRGVKIAVSIAIEVSDYCEVAIVTPYCKVVEKTRELLKENTKVLKHNVSCATVHSYQGSEKDMVIYLVPDNNIRNKLRFFSQKKGDGQPDKLFNVAMSRAKGKFIAVCDVDFLKENMDEEMLFCKFLRRFANDKFLLSKATVNNYYNV